MTAPASRSAKYDQAKSEAWRAWARLGVSPTVAFFDAETPSRLHGPAVDLAKIVGPLAIDVAGAMGARFDHDGHERIMLDATKDCVNAAAADRNSNAMGLLGVWGAGMLVLGIAWIATRPPGRVCPRCSYLVASSAAVSGTCGYQLRPL